MVARTLATAWGTAERGAGLVTWDQVVEAGAILLGTFVLEDAATVAAAMRVQEGAIPVPLALASLYLGIVLGDLGLYGLGRLSARIGCIARLLPPRRTGALRDWLRAHVFRAVVVSRFVPGMRLPTYTTCGYLRVSFKRFAIAAAAATSVWTTLLFSLSLRIGQVLIDHLGAWRWAGAGGFVLALVLTMRLASRPQEQPR